jgi:hypothetical protein
LKGEQLSASAPPRFLGAHSNQLQGTLLKPVLIAERVSNMLKLR